MSKSSSQQRSGSSRYSVENDPVSDLIIFLKTWGRNLHEWLKPELEAIPMGGDEQFLNQEHRLTSKYQQGKYEIQIDITVKEKI